MGILWAGISLFDGVCSGLRSKFGEVFHVEAVKVKSGCAGVYFDYGVFESVIIELE